MVAWLPLAVAFTGLTGLVYLVAQQNLRLGANEPQIQLAEDAATRLAAGVDPADVVAKGNVNVASSLSPFITVYDAARKIAASNARLDGQTPDLPAGVLDYTLAHGRDRVTWQPRTGVRQAIVAVYFHGRKTGFVVAGRSLREVEKRVDTLGAIVGAAWLVILLASLAAAIVVQWFAARLAPRRS